MNFFRSIIAPFLIRWNRLSLRWKGIITTALPITAILVSSVFAFLGNQSRQLIETDIQRKFQLVNTFNEVLTLMVNAETGMRGFQLTKRPEFLQPYEVARRDLPEKMATLQTLIEAEPGEKPRLEKLARLSEAQELVKKQMTDLEWQKNHLSPKSDVDEDLYNHILLGKNYMDSIRRLLGRMENRESELLSERIDQINSIRKRDYLVVFLTLAIALITRLLSWYLFDTGIRRRVRQIVDRLRKLRGDDLPDETKGEIDSLEEEIEFVFQKLKKPTESESEKA